MSESMSDVMDIAGAELRHLSRVLGDVGVHAWDRLLGWFVDDWFRLDVFGLENVPAEGPAVLVANHSGAWGLDAFVLLKALSRSVPRQVRVLADPLVFRTPVLGPYAQAMGAVPVDPRVGLEHLRAGELVGVFPEGMSGLEKPFRERYRLRSFSPGFAVAALNAGVPVVPISVIGAEESVPRLGEIPSLARLFKLPFFPVTPAFPLPGKWRITVGEAIPAPERPQGFRDRSLLARSFSAEVRAALQELVDREREQRDIGLRAG
ncbi:lysophospholipid acyltransferase family protein [Streptomyces sp. NPDC097619]|uniref:lysophospholipid acyltransferase family protein n=1 Tax=Streptomyces sp. NPDC097619 TaxID=3157228 RepID=UPI00331D1258